MLNQSLFIILFKLNIYFEDVNLCAGGMIENEQINIFDVVILINNILDVD